MQFTLFDVGHGFCAFLVAANKNVILFDCGHEEDGFRPSVYLRPRCSAIERLVITNFDEDHVSDLPNLTSVYPGRIQEVQVNVSLPVATLRAIKSEGGPLGPGVSEMLRVMGGLRPNPDPVDFAEVQLSTFANGYPQFTDTNNLSIVTFVTAHDTTICLPGDLERPGWQALLAKRDFRERLAGTRIFVAAHHGRESGYCPEVFEYCRPDLVLISDEPVRYDTQEVPYERHAKGVPWSDRTVRRVLTTRRDGHIEITTGEMGGYLPRTWR